jgi:hypothetical protein
MTKEQIVDYGTKHTPIHIYRGVENFKFLSIHITKDLSCSKQINTVAQQHLFPLRRMKRFAMGPQILKKLYNCTTERILTGCIPACCVQPNTSLGPRSLTSIPDGVSVKFRGRP